MAFVGFGKPGREALEHALRAQSALPVTYHGGLETAPGFTLMRTLEPLGSGPAVFGRAVAGLEAWAVYPAWMTLSPHPAPLAEGTCVTLLTGFGPVWTVNAVRVVAARRTPRRFSFTLGTLPQHALTGLERFSVYLDETETVWYEITAVSRPRHPLAKLGAPALRLVQRRFARDSVQSLRRFVAQAL